MNAAGNPEGGVGWPTTALGLHLLGILHAHEGRYGEAEAAFLRAVEVDPEMVGSYVELGLVHVCRSNYRRMLEALRRAVDISPSAVRAYLGERPMGNLPAEPFGGEQEDILAIKRDKGRAILSAVVLAMSDIAAG